MIASKTQTHKTRGRIGFFVRHIEHQLDSLPLWLPDQRDLHQLPRRQTAQGIRLRAFHFKVHASPILRSAAIHMIPKKPQHLGPTLLHPLPDARHRRAILKFEQFRQDILANGRLVVVRQRLLSLSQVISNQKHHQKNGGQ